MSGLPGSELDRLAIEIGGLAELALLDRARRPFARRHRNELPSRFTRLLIGGHGGGEVTLLFADPTHRDLHIGLLGTGQFAVSAGARALRSAGSWIGVRLQLVAADQAARPADREGPEARRFDKSVSWLKTPPG